MPTPTAISASYASIIICTSSAYFYCIRCNLIKCKMCTIHMNYVALQTSFCISFWNSEIVDIYGKYVSQNKANKINFCMLLLHELPNDCASCLGFFKKDAPQNSSALLSLIPYSPVTFSLSLFCTHCANVCARVRVSVCACLRLKHVSQCPSLHGSIPV